MGFGDFLGKVAGKFVAEAEEANMYKHGYERMNDADLIREYKAMKSKSGTEYRLRRLAIKMILNDRGYDL